MSPLISGRIVAVIGRQRTDHFSEIAPLNQITACFPSAATTPLTPAALAFPLGSRR